MFQNDGIFASIYNRMSPKSTHRDLRARITRVQWKRKKNPSHDSNELQFKYSLKSAANLFQFPNWTTLYRNGAATGAWHTPYTHQWRRTVRELALRRVRLWWSVRLC